MPTQLSPYGRYVTCGLHEMTPSVQILLDAFLHTGLVPERRVLLLVGADRATPRLWCHYLLYEEDPYENLREEEDELLTDGPHLWDLAFLLDASLPLLLEALKRRLGEQAPSINTEVRCRKPGDTTSYGQDILAPAVYIAEANQPAWAFRISDKSIRACVASLVKSWLFADDESRKGLQDKMESVAVLIMRNIFDRPETYERIGPPRLLWDILVEEGCCLGVDGDDTWESSTDRTPPAQAVADDGRDG